MLAPACRKKTSAVVVGPPRYPRRSHVRGRPLRPGETRHRRVGQGRAQTDQVAFRAAPTRRWGPRYAPRGARSLAGVPVGHGCRTAGVGPRVAAKGRGARKRQPQLAGPGRCQSRLQLQQGLGQNSLLCPDHRCSAAQLRQSRLTPTRVRRPAWSRSHVAQFPTPSTRLSF